MAPRFAGLLVPSLLLLVAACSSDLFHSTEWQTLCEKNPKANGCPGANDEAATDAASTASTTSGAGGAGGGGGSGGAGAAMQCVQEATCDGCRACTRPLLCAVEVANCAAEAECQPLLDCFYACPVNDLACAQTCVADHPAGQDTAIALFTCEACGECQPVCGYTCP
jgi:hypothetical protein